MSSRNYKRLDPVGFGHQLITSKDLDPIYVALVRMNFSEEQLARWLVAYWCFYHAGFASWASEFEEGGDFWSSLLEAAANEIEAPPGGRWPRGSERRHFRGEQALKAVRELSDRYKDPFEMVEYIAGIPNPEAPQMFADVSKRAREHRGFGPWISFKIGDMIDRVVGVDVDFDNAAVFMFDDPVKGVLLLNRWIGLGERVNFDPKEVLSVLDEKKTASEDEIQFALGYLTGKLGTLLAPPSNDRRVGLQELETVLCKWKSHLRGHYPLFNDITEIRHGLDGWGKTAEKFKAEMPAANNILLR